MTGKGVFTDVVKCPCYQGTLLGGGEIKSMSEIRFVLLENNDSVYIFKNVKLMY